MAYTDQTAIFVYKGLFTHQQADAGAENDNYFKTGNVVPTGNWGPTGDWTWTPDGATIPININQDNDAASINIDSESTSNAAIQIDTKRGMFINVTIAGGFGIEVANAHSGEDYKGPNYSVTNGYISAGGNEALRWDVVHFDLDGTSTDTVAYTLDGLKCESMAAIGYDVSEDDVTCTTDTSEGFFTQPEHNGANLVIRYGASFVNGDDARVIIFTSA